MNDKDVVSEHTKALVAEINAKNPGWTAVERTDAELAQYVCGCPDSPDIQPVAPEIEYFEVVAASPAQREDEGWYFQFLSNTGGVIGEPIGPFGTRDEAEKVYAARCC